MRFFRRFFLLSGITFFILTFMSKKTRSDLLLLATAFIWGISYVVQKEGGAIGTFTFTGTRMMVGVLVLTPLVHLSEKGSLVSGPRRVRQGSPEAAAPAYSRKTLLFGGIFCGCFMFLGTILQQAGLAYIPAGKAGFITATYTLIIPLLSVLMGMKIRKISWFCAVLCMGGLYLLCMTGGTSSALGLGDLLVLIGAFCHSVHFLAVTRYARQVNNMRLCRLQCLTCGVLSLLFAPLEHPEFAAILGAWRSILYVGVCSTAIARVMQMIGQKHTDTPHASIILSLESVFSMLAGVVFLNESMTFIQYFGCALIFLATLLPNLSFGEKGAPQNEQTP